MNQKRDLSEFVNEYIAFKDTSDNAEVVAHGDRIHHVHQDAVDLGHMNPVLSFVPDATMNCTY